MNTRNTKTKLLIGASMLTAVLAGCGSASPEQGAGELWLYERGVARCVNVSHVSFRTSRWVVYTLEDGTEHNAPGPLEYYPGLRCSR